MRAETNLPDTDTITIVTPQFVVMNDEELERRYRVIIENDDRTPMEFVVMILQGIFELGYTSAMQVMLEAHHFGRAVVTVLPLSEAQERVYQAHNLAREAGYPLTFYLEPEE